MKYANLTSFGNVFGSRTVSIGFRVQFTVGNDKKNFVVGAVVEGCIFYFPRTGATILTEDFKYLVTIFILMHIYFLDRLSIVTINPFSKCRAYVMNTITKVFTGSAVFESSFVSVATLHHPVS